MKIPFRCKTFNSLSQIDGLYIGSRLWIYFVWPHDIFKVMFQGFQPLIKNTQEFFYFLKAHFKTKKKKKKRKSSSEYVGCQAALDIQHFGFLTGYFPVEPNHLHLLCFLPSPSRYFSLQLLIQLNKSITKESTTKLKMQSAKSVF